MLKGKNNSSTPVSFFQTNGQKDLWPNKYKALMIKRDDVFEHQKVTKMCSIDGGLIPSGLVCITVMENVANPCSGKIVNGKFNPVLL